MPHKDPEINREYKRKYNREYYRKHRKKQLEAVKERKEELKIWFQGYQKSLTCERCGEERWYVLEFHHKEPRGENHTITDLVHRLCWSKENILKEIQEKCEILCANCHKEVHFLSG